MDTLATTIIIHYGNQPLMAAPCIMDTSPSTCFCACSWTPLSKNRKRHSTLVYYQGSSLLSVRTLCDFQKSRILPSRSVQFQELENSMAQFGAVFRYCKSYGAVRCGFDKQEITRCDSVRFRKVRNLTVRFGEINLK